MASKELGAPSTLISTTFRRLGFSSLSFNTFRRWIQPTGGLWWHARAWTSRAHWRPTTTCIEDWLLKKAPPAPRLVIIGASAGWMLSHAWLCRFQEIHTWDIDPWAQRLFGLIHGNALTQAGMRWTHHPHDPWLSHEAWQLAGPDTLYWFDNVLGQLPLLFLLSLGASRPRLATRSAAPISPRSRRARGSVPTP